MIGASRDKKNLRSIIAKGSVSVLFIYIILQKIDWHELGGVIGSTDLFFVFLSFLLSPVMVLVSTWKWHVLLRPFNVSVRFSRLFVLYYVGYMFNSTLPTSVGGDVVVSYELAKDTKRPFESVASVLMNRLTGLMILLPAGVLSVIIKSSVFADYRIVSGMVGMVVACVGVVWLILDKRGVSIIERLLGNAKMIRKAVAKGRKLQDALKIYKDERNALVRALGISVVFFLLVVLNVYIGCLAFSIEPAFLDVLVIVPFLQVVSMLPISLGGIGVREWAYMIAFPQIGMAAPVGLSVILLIRAKSVVSGIIGGMLYPLLNRRRRDADTGSGETGEISRANI